MKQSIIFAIVALLSVVPAMAGKRSAELAPPSGSSQLAWGLAHTGKEGRNEIFAVRADASYRDGTRLVVAIELEDRDGGRDWYDVATMEMRLGTAFVSLDNSKDFSRAFPVAAILGVRVQFKGRDFLVGTFED